jgi:hypothetical protein
MKIVSILLVFTAQNTGLVYQITGIPLDIIMEYGLKLVRLLTLIL